MAHGIPARNIGGKGDSSVNVRSSHARSFSLGLRTQKPGYKLRAKVRRRR